MTHTEKYELPLIEGTDVIDYAPFNEGMNKIENALDESDTRVQEAIDDVAEMGDTLNQKVQEVNQALEQTESDVNQSLQETTDAINESVNNKLSKISMFTLARRYDIPEDTYIFGGDSGLLILPITSLTPNLNRVAEGISQPSNNTFYISPSVVGASPVSKIDLEFEVEPTGDSEGMEFDINKYVRVELRQFSVSQGTYITVKDWYINTSVRTPISFSYLATASTNSGFTFRVSSPYQMKLIGQMQLTVENIGMNN